MEKQAREAEPIHSMNVTDDLEPKPMLYEEPDGYRLYALNEGTYLETNPDGSTGTITVKHGVSITIWTQSTIERV